MQDIHRMNFFMQAVWLLDEHMAKNKLKPSGQIKAPGSKPSGLKFLPI